MLALLTMPPAITQSAPEQPPAQAQMHAQTQGQITSQSLEDLQKAAAAGQPKAQFQLGHLYDQGEAGLPRDEKKAVFWWKQSASQNADSAYALALCYQFGAGVKQDAQKSFEYETLASRLGSAEGALALGLHYQIGQIGNEKKESPNKSFSKNPIQAFQFYQLAANRGSVQAQILLGTAYLEGMGTEKNPQKAAQLWEKAANYPNSEAQRLLGALYVEGAENFPTNREKGMELLKKSAEKGNAKAAYQLGGLYENAKPPDYPEALALYQQAGKSGDRRAQARFKMLSKQLSKRTKEASA
ncbi:sel1 repeat family protein [Acetobacteraceae bacterium]|nr:sel1 repeat family protein [Acetobacteraceae bacterium]